MDRQRKKSSAPVSAWLPDDLTAIIDARADRLGLTRSRYLRLIVDKWVTDGCPAVSRADQVMLEMEKEASR